MLENVQFWFTRLGDTGLLVLGNLVMFYSLYSVTASATRTIYKLYSKAVISKSYADTAWEEFSRDRRNKRK